MKLLYALARLVAYKDGKSRMPEACAPAIRPAGESDCTMAPTDSCAFLELDADNMYLVFRALEPQHRQVLALTCRTLHGFHTAVPNLRNQHLSKDQHLEYLACIVRSLPDYWVCEVCRALHPLHHLDTPQCSESMTCPRTFARWKYGAYGLAAVHLDDRHIKLDHRHVQLALKHLRLFNKPGEYAKQLLATHYHDHFRTKNIGKGSANVLATRYSVYPKAVAGADGQLRYLTLSTWQYQPDREPVSLAAMGDMHICPHLGFAPRGVPEGYTFPNHWRYPYRSSDQLAEAIEAALAASSQQQQQQQQEQDEPTRRAAVAETHGACHRCPTDFAVLASPDRGVELHVWQDLGPEGSPTSLAWRVQVADSRLQHRNCVKVGLTLDHEQGSVRALYNGTANLFCDSPLVTLTERLKKARPANETYTNTLWNRPEPPRH